MTKVITRSNPDATVAFGRNERRTPAPSSAPERSQRAARQLKTEAGGASELDRFESFSKGKDVAVALLADLESSRGHDVTCYRRHRDGRPQYRYWRKHLEELIANPALVDGFDAVMSAAFEDGAMVSAVELNAVPAAEFAAGVVGDDGTEPDDERDSAWRALAPIEQDPLRGHTPKQAAIVFERIASMCDTARSLVYEDAQGTQGNHYAIGIMIESIGALADEMVDGEIIGTAADWSVGPSFRKAGKAVQA